MKAPTVRKRLPIGKDRKTHLEMGVTPPREELKVVVDNPAGPGSGGAVPSDMREITILLFPQAWDL